MSWSYIPLELPSKESMTEEEFFNLCSANKHIKIERDENHQILIMPPAGLESDGQSMDIGTDLNNWCRKHKNGKVFGSSAGFTLPDGSVRSPDAAWVSASKWDPLSKEERSKFTHITPDFIVEVLSPSVDLSFVKNKMKMWIRNGVKLAWLIDPFQEKAYIYRGDGTISEVETFNAVLSGEDVLNGFSFHLSALI
jgi:Uma2 family endonuclease